MSPKPVQSTIKLTCCGLGFAERFQWEKETLVDYLAESIWRISEVLDEQTETTPPGRHCQYQELCQIAGAIRNHPNTGLHAKIDLGSRFSDLRGFVAWEKGELADAMIRSIVELGVSDVLKDTHASGEGDEVGMIAFQILFQEDNEGAEKADGANDMRKQIDRADAARVARNISQTEAPQTVVFPPSSDGVQPPKSAVKKAPIRKGQEVA